VVTLVTFIIDIPGSNSDMAQGFLSFSCFCTFTPFKLRSSILKRPLPIRSFPLH